MQWVGCAVKLRLILFWSPAACSQPRMDQSASSVLAMLRGDRCLSPERGKRWHENDRSVSIKAGQNDVGNESGLERCNMQLLFQQLRLYFNIQHIVQEVLNIYLGKRKSGGRDQVTQGREKFSVWTIWGWAKSECSQWESAVFSLQFFLFACFKVILETCWQ